MAAQTLIPAAQADIFWNDEPGNERAAGSEVLILDRSQRFDPNAVFPGLAVSDPEHLLCSTGAMSSGWMEDDHPLSNPAGVFAHNWIAKGSSPEALMSALREFAKIEECSWAREMVAAFDWGKKMEDAPG